MGEKVDTLKHHEPVVNRQAASPKHATKSYPPCKTSNDAYLLMGVRHHQSWLLPGLGGALT